MNDNDRAALEAFIRQGDAGSQAGARNVAPAVDSIEHTLAERGKRYGDFRDTAKIAQDIKKAMWAADGWAKLSDAQAEALEMTANKIARILNGDPSYPDSWHDIEGYARLGGRS